MNATTAERIVILLVVVIFGIASYRGVTGYFEVSEAKAACEKEGGVLLRRSYTGFFSAEKAYYCLPKGATNG